jgi:hypothetical protein
MKPQCEARASSVGCELALGCVICQAAPTLKVGGRGSALHGSTDYQAASRVEILAA